MAVKRQRVIFSIVLGCAVLFSTTSVAGVQIFTDVTASMGISGLTGLGHSVAWCDIDNDGDIDVAVSNQDGSGFWLYRNDVTQFVNITSSSGLAGNGASRILWGEVTGDQYSDLILDTGSSQKLYRNDDGGSFTNITSGSGLTGSPVSMADFNTDGALDILALTSAGCSVLLNSGSGVFTAQPAGTGSWWNGACLDYDNDGDPDIYLGTYGSGANALLRNDGASFTNVTAAAGVTYNSGTSGVTSGDYNNDGLVDIYLGNNSSPGCKLFKNNGDGTFSDVTTSAGVPGYNDTRTSAFVDYNNDGWLDIFSSHHDFYEVSNVMFRNNGDGTFTEVGEDLGLSGEWIGDYFGIAWGDYNLDGDIDLFAVGHIDKWVLYRNDMSETMPANYVVLELEGTTSNRDAIGALVTADLGTHTLTRVIGGGEGYHDYHSLPIEFGLYDAAEIQTLEINWPGGLVETYYNIAANQYIYAVEGDGISGIDDNTGSSEDIILSLECSPNPCADLLTISFSGADGTTAEVTILDLSGRIIEEAGEVQLASQTQSITWNRGSIPAGIYICRLSSSTQKTQLRFTVLQ
ncbi:MAG: FG-GAP-like repeat-containing protein [Candidatus Fermentibacteria bacterium]|nr:FG-GAP-like repeat-containing protein [Candidatus Fermentibacteria bacterium]